MIRYPEVAQANKKLFKKYLLEGKNDAERVGWSNPEVQQERFRVLTEINDCWHNMSLLDVGCGLGGLFGYMKQAGIEPWRYTGVDICGESLLEARKRFLDGDFHLVEDLDQLRHGKQWSFVVASGVFNVAHPENPVATFRVLSTMWELCERGMAVNFMSSQTPNPKNDVCLFRNPVETLDMVMTATNRTRYMLRQDYLVDDFTIYVYKDDVGFHR